jgi:hypothetical protein
MIYKHLAVKRVKKDKNLTMRALTLWKQSVKKVSVKTLKSSNKVTTQAKVISEWL